MGYTVLYAARLTEISDKITLVYFSLGNLQQDMILILRVFDLDQIQAKF